MSKEELFDSITRLAASGLPRRRMIKLSVASLAAAAFGRTALATTCPPGKVADKAGFCCKADTVDKAGYCCSADEGRYLDPNGNCCAQFDEYGYCKDLFPGCVAATCETFISCSASDSDCVCGSVANGGGFCVPGSTPCEGLPACTDNTDCAQGSICLVDTCCGAGVCVSTGLECSATSVKPSKAHNGPTIAHR